MSKLFWVGVAIAPIAAFLLVISHGVGPLRAAAALAILSVVIIGLSVVLRDDAAMVKDDVEDQLRTEVDRLRADIDSLRRGVEVSVHRELERVHHELEATRRESVLRTESSRLNQGRLTGGALPAADDEYADDRQRRGGRSRSERPLKAITANAAEAAADGDPAYDWFGNTGAHDFSEVAKSTERPEGTTYGGTTYGSARASASEPEQGGYWPRRGETSSSSDAGEDGRGRRSTYSSTYGSAASAKPAGTEYSSSAGRRPTEGTTYGSTTYGSVPAEDSGSSRRGRRRADDDPSGGYEAPDYERLDYDDAPPMYAADRSDDGGYRGERNDESAAHHENHENDYDDYWSRSASSRSENSGYPEGGYGREDDWRQRYDREDPQVITGAITGAILDVPYSVGGQALSEPGFGSGNGFGQASGFGAGKGFGASGEFELPNLDHLPQASEPADGGRHASGGDEQGRYRSWQ